MLKGESRAKLTEDQSMKAYLGSHEVQTITVLIPNTEINQQNLHSTSQQKFTKRFIGNEFIKVKWPPVPKVLQ